MKIYGIIYIEIFTERGMSMATVTCKYCGNRYEDSWKYWYNKFCCSNCFDDAGDEIMNIQSIVVLILIVVLTILVIKRIKNNKKKCCCDCDKCCIKCKGQD